MVAQTDYSEGLEKAVTALNPEKFARNWQIGATRLLRAQERLLRGVAAAARLEFSFGQDVVSNRLALLTGQAAKPGAATAQVSAEFEKLTALLQDVSNELRTSFTEAVQLLREGELVTVNDEILPPEPEAVAPVAEPEPVVAPAPEVAAVVEPEGKVEAVAAEAPAAPTAKPAATTKPPARRGKTV